MKKEISVGLLAIVAILLFIWGYNFIKGSNLFQKTDFYYASYHKIDGLAEGNQVVWRGMSVGLVKSIEPIYEGDVSLKVMIEMSKPLRLPQGTMAVISSDGIMGGKVIKLRFDRPCQSDCLNNGDMLVPGVEGLIASMLPKSELNGYMTVVKDNLGGILDTLDQHVADSDTEIGEMLNNLKGTLANLNSITNSMNNLLARTSGKLDNITSHLEGVTETMAMEKEKIRKTLHNVELLTSRLAEARMDSTFILTNRTLSETQASMAEIKNMLEDINNGEGTLGKLVDDPTMYNNLSNATKELDLLLQDFRLNPKRYVNVSVFGKKQKDYVLPEDDPADTLMINHNQ